MHSATGALRGGLLLQADDSRPAVVVLTAPAQHARRKRGGCDVRTKHLKFNQRWAWTNKDVALILEELGGLEHPIVHVCSGASSIGDIRVDRVKVDSNLHLSHGRVGHANVLGDMEQLPIKDGTASTVICDPPYDTKFFDGHGFNGLVCELVRICKPGGRILFFSPWVITHPALSLVSVVPQAVGEKRSYLKLLSVSQKCNGQIGDYVECVAVS